MCLSVKSFEKLLVCAILLGSLLCSNIYLPIINFTPAFLFFSLLLSCVIIGKTIKKGEILLEGTRGFFVCQSILFLCVICAYIINGEVFNQRIVLIFVGMLFCAGVYDSIHDYKDIKFYFAFYIFISAISALVEIGQVLGIEICYRIWYLVQTGDSLEHFSGASRFFGLASNPVNFSYQISTAFVLTLFLDFENKVYLKPLLIVMFSVSLWTNQSRSAMLCVVMAIVVFIFWGQGRNNVKIKKIWVAFGIVVTALLLKKVLNFSLILEESRFVQSRNSTGTKARIPMLLTAFNHTLHYPFGVGEYSVKSELVVGAADAKVYDAVVNNASHNILGNCVARYGFLGLISMLLGYFEIWKSFKNSKNIDNIKIKNIYFSSFLCVCCLFVNALGHNKNLLNGDFSSWLFMGICLTSYKNNISCRKKKEQWIKVTMERK